MSGVAAPATAQPAAKRSHLCLALALLFVLFRALPNISYPLGPDQATYGVIGEGLLRGQKLYRDLWDMKPPAIFWIYAGVVKLFGPVMWSVGVVDILWLLAISGMIFVFAERYVGTTAAVIAVVVNAAWHCRAGHNNAAQTEAFFMLFVFAAYLLVWHEGGGVSALGSHRPPLPNLLPQGLRWPLARHFVAGILLGAAFWLKYNVVVFLPFLLLVPYLDRDRLDARPFHARLAIPWDAWRRRALALLAGVLAAVAGVLGYFWRAGLWTTLWESHFKMLPRYGAFPLEHFSDYWTSPIFRTLGYLGFLTPLAPVVALVIARKRGELARFAPVFAGAVTGYISVVMQVHFFPSAFEACYPFFAMAWGYLGVKAFDYFRRPDRDFAASGRRPERVCLWALIAVVGLVMLLGEGVALAKRYGELYQWSRNPDEFYAHYPEPIPGEHLENEMRVINLLKRESTPGAGAYVWVFYPLIYYLTGLHSPTRFVENLALRAAWSPPAWKDDLIRDLKRSPPTFIVVGRGDPARNVAFTEMDSEQYLKIFPELNAFISDSYRAVAAFPDFVVYRRQ